MNGVDVMTKQSICRRVVFPVALVLIVMVISMNAYDLSRDLKHRLVLAHVSALFMFLSIWMGALFGNTIAYFRGASFRERLLVSLLPPVVWSAKTLYSFVGIYSWGEFAFAVLHNLILGCPVVGLLCMGISEIWCRAVHRKRHGGHSPRILAPANVSVLAAGLILTVLMLWNGGHDYYYLYMDVYSALFL